MDLSFRKSGRTRDLARVSLLVLLIALLDWRVEAEVPLGLLYLLPMALAGGSLSRLLILVLASACAVLAEQFDGFIWNAPTGIPRDLLYFCAFAGCGLFVREALLNRRKSAVHLRELEREMGARRDAEEQLEVLIESSPIAIFTADADGRVLLANDAANRLLLVGRGELGGRDINTFFPSLTNVPALRSGQQSFRTVMQCRGRRNDGELFMAELWFSTYLTAVGPRLAAMAVDTSQDLRDREEENLRHLLSGSRILAGAVSHEVRNVCGAIALVHQNLARSGTLEGNPDFAALGTLVLALERIASLDLREAAEQPARLDLHAFFEELRVIISPGLSEANVRELWHIPPGLPLVWADRQSLMQVFLNLVRNSQAAMARQPARSLTITASAESARVLISVADNGPGIPSPDLLFKPFGGSSTHVGLGLYLSRALMRSFRGDLRFQPRSPTQPGASSQPGATFVLELATVSEVEDALR